MEGKKVYMITEEQLQALMECCDAFSINDEFEDAQYNCDDKNKDMLLEILENFEDWSMADFNKKIESFTDDYNLSHTFFIQVKAQIAMKEALKQVITKTFKKSAKKTK